MSVVDGALAHTIRTRRDDLVALWEEMGEDGPTFGREIAPEPETVRRGYLRALARMLEQALDGSDLHRASYLEARLGYLPKAMPGSERAAWLEELLTAEGRRIAERLQATASDADRIAAALDALHAPLMRAPHPQDPRVLFVGDCLFAEVRTFLSDRWVAQTGRTLDGDHVYFASGIEPLDPDVIRRSIEQAPPTLVGLSMFSFNAVPAYNALVNSAESWLPRRLDGSLATLVDMLRSSIDAIRDVTDAPILVHGASALPLRSRVLRLRYWPAQTPNRKRLAAALTSAVRELVDATENTILVDETQAIAEHGGLREVGQPLLGPEYAGAYAHPSRFGDVLAESYFDVLRSFEVVGRAKALLVDFDNTLWSGVMADGPVTHRPERQRRLRELREAGVLLVALSKNTPEQIRWDELELEPDDFVMQQINWRPKPDNVSEAVARLDLAPDAFVLLDDNPVERALVAENVPGVRTLDPEDAFAWRTLERWLQFPSTTQTDEARRRTQMYREAADRRAALGAREHDYEAMMRSLQLRAEVRPAEPADRDRLLELVQRTNQFNTTTRRRSAAELDALLASEDHTVLVARLADRFGDLGVVAVMIARRLDVDAVEIDSFVMSCRAMGFGLETHALAELMDAVPARRYEADFIATERNGPAASLYPSNGFAEIAPGRWVHEETQPPPRRPVWFADAGA